MTKSKHGKRASGQSQFTASMSKEVIEKAREAAERDDRTLSKWMERLIKQAIGSDCGSILSPLTDRQCEDLRKTAAALGVTVEVFAQMAIAEKVAACGAAQKMGNQLKQKNINETMPPR